MDFCTCTVTQGGDSRSQVVIPARKAASYAEILVLRAVHGGTETVRDIRVVERQNVNPTVLRNQMISVYGDIVLQLYPGVQPNMPTSAEDDPHFVEVAIPKAPTNKGKPSRKSRPEMTARGKPAEPAEADDDEEEDLTFPG